MSQITEQEAREAAAFIADIGNGANEHAPKLLAALMMNILSRRDAERAEREKPITAEWFGGIGDEQLQMLIQRIGDTEYQFEMACESQPGVDLTVIHKDKLNLTHLPTITTRGQLLDLLKALRGGT